jgi:recombination protein RecA
MLVRDMNKSSLTVLIISQVRDKIGMTFGRKTTRSGGRALDFYCSQVVYLAQTGTRSRTIEGQKRITAVSILAKCDKNKVSLPFREARFDIQFGYGIDDMSSCLAYLKEVKALDKIGLKNTMPDEKLRQLARKHGTEPYDDLLSAVEKRWYEIEDKFLPKARKYSNGG